MWTEAVRRPTTVLPAIVRYHRLRDRSVAHLIAEINRRSRPSASINAAIDRFCEEFRHHATSSRRWLQFANSNFRSFETTRRSATRVPPIGLRIARDATRRYFRFYCRNRPARSNARTIRRGVMPRINSTVYEDVPTGRQRTRVHQH